MRVRMKKTMAGPTIVARPGDVIDVPKKFAEELIAGRYAEAAPSEKPTNRTRPESASRSAPENAAEGPAVPSGK